MKRILSFLLLLSLTTTLFAGTTELEKAIDEFQYAITVDWDQKDQAIYDKEVSSFVSKVAELLKTNSITRDDLLSLMDRKLQNNDAANALRLKITTMNSMSPDELTTFLSEHSSGFYSRGASWSGRTLLMVAGFTTLLAAAVLYAVVSSIDFDDEKSLYCKEETAPYYQCHSSELTGYSWCGMQSDCLEWGHR